MPPYADHGMDMSADGRLPYHIRCAQGTASYRRPRKIKAAAGTGHRNAVWATLEAVPYPRCRAGAPVPVAEPDAKSPPQLVDPTLILQTRALSVSREPYCHCAHYYYGGMCALGAGCNFIHVAFVEADVRGGPPRSGSDTNRTVTADGPARRGWFRDPYKGTRVVVMLERRRSPDPP